MVEKLIESVEVMRMEAENWLVLPFRWRCWNEVQVSEGEGDFRNGEEVETSYQDCCRSCCDFEEILIAM